MGFTAVKFFLYRQLGKMIFSCVQRGEAALGGPHSNSEPPRAQSWDAGQCLNFLICGLTFTLQVKTVEYDGEKGLGVREICVLVFCEIC